MQIHILYCQDKNEIMKKVGSQYRGALEYVIEEFDVNY